MGRGTFVCWVSIVNMKTYSSGNLDSRQALIRSNDRSSQPIALTKKYVKTILRHMFEIEKLKQFYIVLLLEICNVLKSRRKFHLIANRLVKYYVTAQKTHNTHTPYKYKQIYYVYNNLMALWVIFSILNVNKSDSLNFIWWTVYFMFNRSVGNISRIEWKGLENKTTTKLYLFFRLGCIIIMYTIMKLLVELNFSHKLYGSKKM